MAQGNKRLAVLVGCNYPHTELKLHGCVNDVVAMRDVLLKRFNFDASHVELLIDVPVTEFSPIRIPTGANIRAALNEMVKKAEAGDILFFHFSGHGTIIPSLEPGEPFRQDEAIVPCDLNFITDVDLRQLIKGLPEGASFTILSDSCHSGGLIDKDKEQIGPSTVKKITAPVHYKDRGVSVHSIHQWLQSAASLVHGTAQAVHTASGFAVGIADALSGIFGKDISLKFRPPTERAFLKSLTEDEGILLSGCQANETSADVPESESANGKAHGAFTNAVLEVLEKNKNPLTNRELVMKAREVLKEHGFEQHPCLYCSDENAKATFLGSQPPKRIPKNTSLNDTVVTNLAGKDKPSLNDTVVTNG